MAARLRTTGSPEASVGPGAPRARDSSPVGNAEESGGWRPQELGYREPKGRAMKTQACSLSALGLKVAILLEIQGQSGPQDELQTSLGSWISLRLPLFTVESEASLGHTESPRPVWVAVEDQPMLRTKTLSQSIHKKNIEKSK